MPKTFLIGRTKSGAIIARASGSDYGYTHAATSPTWAKDHVIHTSMANFSRSADGARRLFDQRGDGATEVVTLEKVDSKTYRLLTGKS